MHAADVRSALKQEEKLALTNLQYLKQWKKKELADNRVAKLGPEKPVMSLCLT